MSHKKSAASKVPDPTEKYSTSKPPASAAMKTTAQLMNQAGGNSGHDNPDNTEKLMNQGSSYKCENPTGRNATRRLMNQ